MSNEHIIRAWKDDVYRQSLSSDELALLPENPAGLTELSDADLGLVVGAAAEPDTVVTTLVCSVLLTSAITVSVSATHTHVSCP